MKYHIQSTPTPRTMADVAMRAATLAGFIFVAKVIRPLTSARSTR